MTHILKYIWWKHDNFSSTDVLGGYIVSNFKVK